MNVETKLKTALKYEREAFEEYYGSELEKDWLLGDLNNHRDRVEMILTGLIDEGIKVEELKSLIKDS